MEQHKEQMFTFIHNYLKKNIDTMIDATHLFQTIALSMSKYTQAQFQWWYEQYVSMDMRDEFETIYKRKMPKPGTKSESLPSTKISPSANTPPTPKEIPMEVANYISTILSTISLPYKSQKELRCYLARLYRNKKPIKLQFLQSTYGIDPNIFSPNILTQWEQLGITFEKILPTDPISPQEQETSKAEEMAEEMAEEVGGEVPYPLEEHIDADASATKIHVPQQQAEVATDKISSMEECIQLFTDTWYVFFNLETFTKQFEDLYPNQFLKDIARRIIQKKISHLKKKNSGKIKFWTMEFPRSGHRILFYEDRNTKKITVHGIFTHDESDRQLGILKKTLNQHDFAK